MRTFPEWILSTMAETWCALLTRLKAWLQFLCRLEAPPVVLILALSTVFLFSNDRGIFYRPGHHDWVTSQYLAQTVNLSPEHNFLSFVARTLNRTGETEYLVYERWPIGSIVLTKLAILLVGDDLSAQIYAARIVMLLFFCGSGLLAYASLARLIDDRLIACVATLVPFSSYYALYYNDAFAPDIGPALFGVLLTFHGMTLVAQEGRFRQLLVKACMALLLSWHVYALLVPFIVLGLTNALIAKTVRSFRLSPLTSGNQTADRKISAGRYLTLGAVTGFWGLSVLSFNVVTAYFAFNGQITLTEIPLFQSLNMRFFEGASSLVATNPHLAWPIYLENEFYRIARLTLPFTLSPFENPAVSGESGDTLAVIIGMFTLKICLVGLIFAPNRILLGSFVISGFFLTLPLRNHVGFHDFCSLFYIGLPLTAISFILLYIRKLFGYKFIHTSAGVALTLFVSSSADIALVGQDAAKSLREADVIEDFELIRGIVDGHVVYVPRRILDLDLGWMPFASRYFGAPLAPNYFLAGNILLFDVPIMTRNLHRLITDSRMNQELADFVILAVRYPSPGLLTPENRRIFLYDRDPFVEFYDDKLPGDPIISGDYQVYLRDKLLIYVRDLWSKCGNDHSPLFLHIFPSDVAVLQENRKGQGFDNMDFFLADFSVTEAPRCIAVRQLPKYDIAAIRTGQSIAAKGRLWEGTYLIGNKSP